MVDDGWRTFWQTTGDYVGNSVVWLLGAYEQYQIKRSIQQQKQANGIIDQGISELNSHIEDLDIILDHTYPISQKKRLATVKMVLINARREQEALTQAIAMLERELIP